MRQVSVEKLHRLNRLCVSHKERYATLPACNKKRTTGLVSVVFLTWERDAHIEIAIDSFLKFKNQVEPDVPVQLISIDNGSKNPRINQILSKYKWDLRIKNPSNIGISAALTKAYIASTGEFVICFEDDWQTVATRPMLGPSIRIMNEYPDIGGVRLRETIQNCIKSKTIADSKRLRVEFDPLLMEKSGTPWKGKYGRRKWFDERKTTMDDAFYTWTHAARAVPSVYCNPCFLFRGEIFDRTKPIRNEAKYSLNIGNICNAAVLVDENKVFHRGEIRHGGKWHE